MAGEWMNSSVCGEQVQVEFSNEHHSNKAARLLLLLPVQMMPAKIRKVK